MAEEIDALADGLFEFANEFPSVETGVAPGDVRAVASVTEQSVEIAGVQVRWVDVVLNGHTVEQVLSYDVAEAEAVFGRPFDDAMDTRMRFAMFAADRIWLDETMWKVASAVSYVLDGKCIKMAKIEHCSDIAPASSYWSINRADGTPVERKPWSCVPGTAPISHLELIGASDEA